MLRTSSLFALLVLTASPALAQDDFKALPPRHYQAMRVQS